MPFHGKAGGYIQLAGIPNRKLSAFVRLRRSFVQICYEDRKIPGLLALMPSRFHFVTAKVFETMAGS